MKRALSIIFIAVLLVGLIVPGAEATGSQKLPVVLGAGSDEETDVVSTGSCTRGEWISKLVETFDLVISAEEYPDNYFTDIADSLYYDDIMTAAKFGLIDVEAGEAFRPEDPLTREFAAHTVNFYLGFRPEDDTYTFADSDRTEYASDAQVALSRGWFQLSGDNFMPEAQVTDDEIDKILTDAQAVVDVTVAGAPKSEYTFAEGVKEIARGTQVEIDENRVDIHNCPVELESGDVFAVYMDNIALVYTADAVETDKDGVTSVTTGDAPDGSILSAEAAGSMDIDIAEDFTPSEETLSIALTNGEIMTIDAVKISSPRKSGTLSLSRSIKVGNGIKGNISCDISNVDLDYNLGVSENWVTVDGDMDVDISISVDLMELTGNEEAIHLELGYINLGVGKIVFAVEINLKGQVSYSSTMYFRVGLEYSDGSFRPITNFNKKSYSISAEAELSAMLASEMKVDLGILKANAAFKVGPIMSFDLVQHSEGTPEQCVTIAGYLYAGGSYSGSYNGFLVKKSCGDSFELFSSRNSPIRTSEHWEDGIQVSACTRGQETGVKYVSPPDTRYASSGRRDFNTGGSGGGAGSSVWEYKVDDTGNATITKYTGTASAVTIPEKIDGYTVTEIGDYAFRENNYIRSIVITDTVVTIGSYAFSDCTNLKSASFGSGIETIEQSAFYGTALIEARLPEGLIKLEGGAFMDCVNLQKVYIPSTLAEANVWGGGRTVFRGCVNLDNIEFGKGIAQIAPTLFCDCPGLTHIEIPDTVTIIGERAFSECNGLNEVVIPEYVTKIDSSAFSNCSNLKSVTFNENLLTIGMCAFQGTALTDVHLPEGLTMLNGGAFMNCVDLKKIYIPSTLVEANVWGGGTTVFKGCVNLDNIEFGKGIAQIAPTLFCDCPGLTHIEIPDTVTIIGERAFSGCNGLNEVVIPEYVTKIDSSAFSNCSNLKSVTFNENLLTIGMCAFQGTAMTDVHLPEGLTMLNGGAFMNCVDLKKIYIPSTLVEANVWGGGTTVFKGCVNLDNIEFGKGIAQIAPTLFCDCPGLTHIEIPDTVTTIGERGFSGCVNLEKVYIPDSVTVIPSSGFSGCSSLESIEAHNLKTIGGNSFADCTKLTDLSWLPYTTELINNYAFAGCTGLITADIPDYVTELGANAFSDCTKLRTVHAGAGLQITGSKCFQGCKELEKVDLNEGLTEIRTYAFQGCASLSGISIPDTVTTIGTYCFQDNKKLTSVTLSDNLSDIPAYAFSGCSILPEIVILKGVVTIAANAFYQDPMLKTVEIPGTVTSIGSNAFSYASSTTVRGVKGSYAETYAKWKEFIDITKPADAVSFKGGEASLVLGRYQTVTPRFDISPLDSTDVVTEIKSDSSNVTVNARNMTIYGNKAGTANITVTTSNGGTFTLAVTVPGRLTGIEIAKMPEKVSYKIGEEKDMTGLEVNAVFDDGSTQRVYDYTVSHFTTDVIGTREVIVTYNKLAAAFPVTVIDGEGNGSMGENQELRWKLDTETGTLAATGEISDGDTVLAAVYDKSGRMTDVRKLPVNGEGVPVGAEFGSITIMWLGQDLAPKCSGSVIVI